jgi:hypothetical protein
MLIRMICLPVFPLLKYLPGTKDQPQHGNQPIRSKHNHLPGIFDVQLPQDEPA